jgi:RimJ/RimL family protein N-acetyltransferase
MDISVRTDRLDLILASRRILESDRGDRTELARLLHAEIPAAWPPPLMDEGVIREFIGMSSAVSGPVFAAWYWVLNDPKERSRILIGNGGILGAKSGPENVVLGYSVLDKYRNRGYATEAVRALIPEIFSLPGIRRIIATTYPDLGASIRVLEKNGFVRTDRAPVGTGAEEGTVCFVRKKT